MMFFVPTIHSSIDKFGWMDCKVATEFTLTAELVIVKREREGATSYYCNYIIDCSTTMSFRMSSGYMKQ